MSKNNYDSNLIVLLLTGKISLASFKDRVDPDTMQTLHSETGKSIAHFASASHRYEFASDAIEWMHTELGLDLNHVDSEGNTMLHIAAEFGNQELLEYLLFSGVDRDIQNKQGETALFTVLHTFDSDVSEILLRHGASVDIKNIDGDTIIELCEGDDEPEEYEEILEQLHFYKNENTSEHTVKIYSEKKLSKAMKEITDGESPTIPLYNNMMNFGENRVLAKVSKDVFKQVGELKERFPHFVEVIEKIQEDISLSLLAEEPYFAIKPLLMLGGAGVGKTRFNKELNKVIGSEFIVIDGGNVSAGFVIGGHSPAWRDSSPGKIAKQLINGQVANPIIQLDEIDKMSAQTGYDPFGPLYPLLEYNTAAEFIDEFVGIPMDCSYVNWIATANTLSTIPAPILDRFEVITVPNPSKEQMVDITKSVYNDIINDPKHPWGKRFHEQLDNSIIDNLVSKTPREINRILLSAMGKVALKELDSERPEDTLISIKSDDIDFKRIGRKTPMGLV